MRDDDRLSAFLEQLPASVQWAIEFRHDSWHDTAVEALLRRFNVSWVAADTDERLAECRDTANFWYVRLRRSAYDEGDLAKWAAKFRKMVDEGKSCYVYCKHEDEGSPWVWADTVKAEGIERQFRGKIERRLHVLNGFIGVPDRKKPVDDLDAGLFGIGHRLGHFFQSLFFLEPIQNLLAAALDPEHDGPAMGLGHGREEMLRDGVYPSFDAPLNGQVFLLHAVADRFNAFRLEEKVVVDEIDGAIPVRFEMLELGDDMCGTARPPFAFVEDRNVAKDARPGAAA